MISRQAGNETGNGKRESNSPTSLKRCRAKDLNGAPGGARTPNLLIRSQMLYPIALRARTGLKVTTRPSPFHACPGAACSDTGTHQPAEIRE
jgi:hypothetical protein